MKRASLWLALSLAAALPFHGQNSATVALGGTSSHGDRETLKGLTQIPGVEGFSLEDVRWSGTSGDLRRDAEGFLRRTGDGRLALRWEVPASWCLRIEARHVVTDEPPGPTNFSPDVPAFFGRHPRYLSLGETPRRRLWMGDVRLDLAVGERAAAFGLLRVLDEGGSARALRGGSFGSAIDFSLPTREDPTASVLEARAGLALRRGAFTLSAEAAAGSFDGGRTQVVRQFGGFALDRTLLDTSEQRINEGEGTVRLQWRPENGRFDAAVGLSAKNAVNEPRSSLEVKDRLFPGASWSGSGLRSEADSFCLFASAHYRPAPSVEVGYGGNLSEEEVDSEGVLGLGPFLPTPFVAVHEDLWLHEEGLSLSWRPSRTLSLTAGGTLGWRRFERATVEGVERDRQDRNDARLRLRWKPFRSFETILSFQDRKRDARGDLGDRLLRIRSGSAEAVVRPLPRLEVRGLLSREATTADLRYGLESTSRNRIREDRAGLSASLALSSGAVLFFQGDHRRWSTYFQGLLPPTPEALFFGPGYEERTTSVQAGASLPLGERWHATAFAGQTLLAGTEAYRFPVLSATVDFDWKPNLTLSFRGQISGFHRYAYAFENGSADTLAAALTWKF